MSGTTLSERDFDEGERGFEIDGYAMCKLHKFICPFSLSGTRPNCPCIVKACATTQTHGLVAVIIELCGFSVGIRVAVGERRAWVKVNGFQSDRSN